MNIKKSLDVALAKKGISKTEFAKTLGISRTRLYAITRQKRIHGDTLEMLASGLDMQIGEFITLGE